MTLVCVSKGCYNKLGGFRLQKSILSDLEARSLKGVDKVMFSLNPLGQNPSLLLPDFGNLLAIFVIPWFAAAKLQSLPLSHDIFSVFLPVSNFPCYFKNVSHWIRSYPNPV